MNDHPMATADDSVFTASGSTEKAKPETADRASGQRRRRLNSIAWKILIPVPIVTVVALIVGWLTIPQVIRDNVRKDSVETAQQIVFQFKALRKYYTQNIVTKAIKTGSLKPSVDHKGSANRIPLPATMIHDMSRVLQSQSTRITLYSGYPWPNRSRRQLDDFQKKAWSFLVKNPNKPFVLQTTRNGQPVVRVAVADRMVAKACVDCHNNRPGSPRTDWKLGDVRGVLEVVRNVAKPLAAGRELSNMILFGIFGAGLLLIGMSLVMGRRVAKPIGTMVTAMGRLAERDSSVEIAGTERRDEIGDMARATEVFKRNAIEMEGMEAEKKGAAQAAEEKRREGLRALADGFENNVRSVVDGVSSAVTELQTTAGSMNGQIEQANQLAMTVATSSEAATTNVQTVAAATEEMSSSVTEIGRQMAQSTEIANRAVAEARNTNETVQGLSVAAQKVGEVVGLISDIAEQTNLLALNATIEAARAGEAGKGFAVVASEVKSLAEQTAKATEEISTQIASIQSETGTAVQAIEGIGNTINEINDISTTIAAAVDEQGAATEEIARNVQEAATGTTEVTNNIGEVSNASMQASGAAGEVLAAAGELSKRSEQLGAEIQRFLDGVRES